MSSAMNKEKSKIFETLLSSPGMAEKCKIILQLSRQNVMLLGRLIEAGLLTKEHPFDDAIVNALSNETQEEFRAIHEEILRKADLTEFYQRLKSI
jgi:hypothetical protein